MQSQQGQIIWQDIKSLFITALLTGVASFIAFLIANITNYDFAGYAYIVVPVATIILKAVQKWVSATTYKN